MQRQGHERDAADPAGGAEGADGEPGAQGHALPAELPRQLGRPVRLVGGLQEVQEELGALLPLLLGLRRQEQVRDENKFFGNRVLKKFDEPAVVL